MSEKVQMFFGEVEEHELGMLRPEEPEFAKMIFPRDLESALAYRHMIAAVYIMQRGFPCFRARDEEQGTYVLSRQRLWTLQYKIESKWLLYNAKLKTVFTFHEIGDVVRYLKEKL